jgi:hypothetical protein
MKRKECKELQKEVKALKLFFEELQASHESIKGDHEEQVIVSCDVGLICDILDESFYKPIVTAPTNPSCSTSTSTSSIIDGFTCDASLMVENETLKKVVNELTRTLGNAYGDEDCLLICLDSQRGSLYKEGLGNTPRKVRRPLLLTRLVL